MDPQSPIAIGSRLARIEWVRTLGVRPNLADYPAGDLESIQRAEVIYYPTPFFAASFTAMGKRVFPALMCYLHRGDKIAQTTLFNLQGVPHPKTRVYYGRQRRRILDDFDFPFVAKTPRHSGQGRGVFLIHDRDQMARYLDNHRVAYIQEYLDIDRDLRVVLINYRAVAAYWRIAAPGQWRTNVHLGGVVSLKNVPRQGVEFAADVARRCGFDEVGLDVCLHRERWLAVEANMKFGTKGLRLAGIDVSTVVGDMIKSGEL